jgi:hypothetical protein
VPLTPRAGASDTWSMEAIFVGVLSKVSADAFLGAVKAAWRYRKGGSDSAERDVAEAYELGLRLLGSLLFETRANVERVRLMVQHSATNSVTFGMFDFSITDALLPDLCRVVTTPQVLESCRVVLAMIRRVDVYQRGGPRDVSQYGMAIQFAKDALAKDLVARFNELVDYGMRVAAEVFQTNALPDGWSGLFPARIDPRAQIDHSIL